MTTYRLATDGEGVESVYMDDPDRPLLCPLVRRTDVSPETWPLIVAGVDASQTARSLAAARSALAAVREVRAAAREAAVTDATPEDRAEFWTGA